jgi:hypothetical protein
MGNIKSILDPAGAITGKKAKFYKYIDPIGSKIIDKVRPETNVTSDLNDVMDVSQDNLATEISAREAARIEANRLKKKRGFRSTILTGPLGDPNNPPLKKTEIL